MQKFTRAVTREVEVAGVRLAITLDEKGVSVRPVGSRRPPHEASWAAVLSALARRPSQSEPAADEVRQAVEALSSGSSAAAPPPPADDSVAGLLARLDAWLKKNRRRYHKGLLAGATDKALADLAEQLGRPLPEELTAWLRWHDGQNEELIGCFVESFQVMSVAEIVAAMQEYRGTKGWDPAFVPLLDDHQDDYVVVDVSKPDLPVREVWRGRDDHPEVATSMRGWLAHLLAEFEAGKYHEESERGEFMRESD